MLTNNGIHALSMDLDYTYTDTTGAERTIDSITGYTSSSSNSYGTAYYYTLTPYTTHNTSSYTDELTSYTYLLIHSSTQSSAYSCASAPLIYVGTGTTEAALTDHCLAERNTTLTPQYGACTRSGLTYNTIRTFLNETDEDITITEMGLYLARSTSSTASYPILIARQILSSPVTIGADETYTFTYALTTGYVTEA